MRRTAPVFERLEQRTALAVTVGLEAGWLDVVGDAAANTVEVTRLPEQQLIRVSVVSPQRRGPAETRIDEFPAADVRTIRFAGGAGNDTFRNLTDLPCLADGGPGNDVLQGGGAPDVLRGGVGRDTLRGGPGNDGLYGGDGVDGMWGDEGSDRLLQRRGEREARSLAAADAVVTFAVGGRAWTQSQIELVDTALALLHDRAGTADVLERADGRPVTLTRGRSDRFDPDTLAVNFENGRITLYDSAFSDPDLLRLTVIHEMGHNWDDPEENPLQAEWLAASGWTERSPGDDPAFEPSDDGSWWYRGGAPFALDYGRTNPYEDWCTAWEYHFQTRYDLPDTQGLAWIGGVKAGIVERFFDSFTAVG